MCFNTNNSKICLKFNKRIYFPFSNFESLIFVMSLFQSLCVHCEGKQFLHPGSAYNLVRTDGQ